MNGRTLIGILVGVLLGIGIAVGAYFYADRVQTSAEATAVAQIATGVAATLTAEPTQTPRPTHTPNPTYTPLPTQTALPTYTPFPSPTPTLTPLPTFTPIPTDTVETVVEAVATAEPTAVPLPTLTPTPAEAQFAFYTETQILQQLLEIAQQQGLPLSAQSSTVSLENNLVTLRNEQNFFGVILVTEVIVRFDVVNGQAIPVITKADVNGEPLTQDVIRSLEVEIERGFVAELRDEYAMRTVESITMSGGRMIIKYFR